MPRTDERPNLIIIIMDDLCWGDLACHGNPHTSTPNLDCLHSEATRLTAYRSGPLCSPARASAMTGRYHYRTGVVDTYIGRSMMHGDEVTLANVLHDAGYHTGAFGKWHLGDNHPMRTVDQGFDESVVHNGGGIGQPGDFEGNTYFDPVLHHNGKPEKYTGYCTDIFGDAAVSFIEANRDEPFFAYVATNCPHSPFQIADEWVKKYADMGLPEKHAKVYGMVENIDVNVGKIMDKLDELGIADDTIVMFTSDHGPCGSATDNGKVRFNADLRGIKGTMYDGGVTVPALIRYPKRFQKGVDVGCIASPIDLMPTFASACGAKMPTDRVIDGSDLTSLLTGEHRPADWPDRTLFMQWHRGDAPERGRNCAVITQRYKLVDKKELYDLDADPLETTDIASQHTDVVAAMASDYDRWYDHVSATRGYDAPRIVFDGEKENPSVLTRQDWRGPGRVGMGEGEGGTGWGDKEVGYWECHVARPTQFAINVRIVTPESPGTAHLRIGDQHLVKDIVPGDRIARFDPITLEAGDARVEAWTEVADATCGARYVDVHSVRDDTSTVGVVQ